VEAAEDAGAASSEDDPGVGGVMCRKSWRSVRLDNSTSWPPSRLRSGRRRPRRRSSGTWTSSVAALLGGHLGELEGPEDPATQLQGVVDALHPGRVLGELIVTEPRLRGPGGNDEMVVGLGGTASVHQGGGHGLGGQVDRGDLAEDDGGVLLLGQDLARRRGDLALATGCRWRPDRAAAGRGGGLSWRSARDVDIGPARARAANRPPKPDPMMTTVGRLGEAVRALSMSGATGGQRPFVPVRERESRHGRCTSPSSPLLRA
jgi:hypothetical protein